MNYVYVKRLKDGATFDIPEKNLEDTLKQGFELVSAVNVTAEVPQVEEFVCPICDKVFKTEQGLKVHKSKHK
jgi:hypothetical protein